MKYPVFTLAVVLFGLHVFAQAPTIQWEKSMGGTGFDQAYQVQPTSDSGFIIAGSTNSTDGDVTVHHGSNDYWIVKLSAAGSLLWQKSLGGTSNDQAYFIQQTFDGGYIVAGASISIDGDVTGNHGGGDYWIVKLDDTGHIMWEKCLGGSLSDQPNSVQQTSDSGYIIAGQSISTDGNVTGNHGNNDYWIVKLSASGSLVWQKSLGGSNYDEANSIQQTSDGGYIVAGFSISNDGNVTGNHGGQDYWVVKINDTGAIQWQRSLGGSSADEAFFVRQTFDGGYVVTGRSFSTDGDVTGHHGSSTDEDYWVVKLNDTGGIQWQKSLGGTGNEESYSIQQTADSGYIVAGGSTSADGDVTGNHGNEDDWIVKLNSTGSIQWEKALGGGFGDLCYSAHPTPDGGYILAGWSSSVDGDVTGNHGGLDYWIVKLTCGLNAGTITGRDTVCFGSHITLTDTASGGTWSMANGNATISGSTVTGVAAGTDTAIYTVTNTCGSAITSFPLTVVMCPYLELSPVNNIPQIAIIPNPTTGNISITGTNSVNIKVYNILGQLIKEAANTSNISISDFPLGMYFVRLFNEQGALIKQDKIIKNP